MIIKLAFLTEKDIHNIPDALMHKLKFEKFEGKYQEFFGYYEEDIKIVLVGTSLPETKTIDPFFKADFYELGTKIAKELEKSNLSEAKIEINTLSTLYNIETAKPLSIFELSRSYLGLKQGFWQFSKYKSKSSPSPEIELAPELLNEKLIAEIARINIISEGMSLTRGLVEEVPEALNPDSVEEILVESLGKFTKLSYKVYDHNWILEQNMGGVWAVGKASSHKPRFVHAILKPNKAVKQKIVLVGKGLTYDCGGLDIKTGGRMAEMKMDMGGSALMWGTIRTLAKLDTLEHTEVHWLTAFAENMIDGTAYKSDDILTTHSGQTVEVLNTDAEGRLTLADALSFATTLEPDYIIDAATLTGAVILANSPWSTGLMGNNSAMIEDLMQEFIKEGEHTSHNIMQEKLRQYLKGRLSDLQNISKIKPAGHLTAGLFLSYFIDQSYYREEVLKNVFKKANKEEAKAYNWVHLDIAGTCMNKNHNTLHKYTATANNLRGLVNWIERKDISLQH